MTTHKTGTREEWLAARIKLLEAEKELTRRSDALAEQRQALPWVRIDKEYRFDTDAGKASLKDLFQGRSQLLVYHFMFGPDYTAGCPSCSAIADGFDGVTTHLAHHDVTLMAMSRAPLAKLQAYKRRLGWHFPWASAFESDFNADFNVFFTEVQQREGGIEYNYRREPPLAEREPLAGKTVQEWKQEGRGPVGQMAATSGTDPATYTRERLERLRAGRRHRLSHLFRLCPRAGRHLEHVSVARPRAEGTQRIRHLVAAPRRIREEGELSLPRKRRRWMPWRAGCRSAEPAGPAGPCHSSACGSR
jgi:predicted dithiol-disulfide oxidoreductase (DUF899 family)